MEQEQKVSEAKKAKDALFYQTEHAAKRVSPQELEASNAFAADYMAFLNVSKTEREAVHFAVAELEKHGFVPFQPGMALKAGDKIYQNNRGKAVIAAL